MTIIKLRAYSDEPTPAAIIAIMRWAQQAGWLTARCARAQDDAPMQLDAGTYLLPYDLWVDVDKSLEATDA